MGHDSQFEEPLVKAYQEALARWRGVPTVTGVDIGFLRSEGRTDELCVRIHSRSPDVISSAELKIFSERMGVPVEVIKVSYRIEACPKPYPRLQRLDPIQPGISVGPKNTSPGTLGLLVRDLSTKKAALLSCAHVLADCPPTGGTPKIFQPAPDDCGSPNANLVGKLERWTLGLAGDAAIARFNESRGIDLRQFGSLVTIKNIRMAQVGEIVEKSGRTTGVTRGKIDGMGTYFIDCGGRKDVEGFRVVPEEDADLSKEISFPGDSGAAWYSVGSHDGLGLHFAGEETGETKEYALACHLPRVFRALNIELA